MHLGSVCDETGNEEADVLMCSRLIELLVQGSHPRRHLIWNSTLGIGDINHFSTR